MGGLMLLATLVAAPLVTGGVTADGTYGTDAQTPHAYPNGVLSGQVSYADVAGGGQFSFGYNPRLTLSNAPDPITSHVAFFQVGTFGYTVRDGTEVYGFTQAVSYGEQDYSLLSQSLTAGSTASGTGVPTQPGQTSPDRRPVQRFISTLNAITTASLQTLFTPRFTGGAASSFSVGGGQGSAGRAALPLQRSGVLSLATGYQVSPLDTFSATASGTGSITGANQASSSVGAQLSWAHSFDPDLRGSAGVGIALLYNASATEAAVANQVGNQGKIFSPTGTASLAWNVPVRAQNLSFALNGALAPALDPFSGATYMRGNARFTAAWTPVEDWTLTASAIGDRIVGGSLSGAFGAGGDATLTHRLSPSASAHLGVRAALVAPDHPLLTGEGPPSLWAVLAGFTATLPGAERK